MIPICCLQDQGHCKQAEADRDVDGPDRLDFFFKEVIIMSSSIIITKQQQSSSGQGRI